MESLAELPPFRVNCYPNDEANLYSETSRILNANFVRVANRKVWHIAFHLKAETQTNALKAEMSKILLKLQSLDS
jgi:hypothetical protein